MFKLRLQLLTGLLFIAFVASSMPGPGSGPPGGGPPGGGGGPPCWAPPCVPIDGAVILLILGGAVLGVKLILKRSNS